MAKSQVLVSRGAMVRGAMFQGAVFQGAVFQGAMFQGAVFRGALWGALTMAAMACGSAQHPAGKQSAATTETVPEDPVGEAPTCVDDKEQPVTCLSDSDCCAGFVCGKDPELSRRTSYCIYGG